MKRFFISLLLLLLLTSCENNVDINKETNEPARETPLLKTEAEVEATDNLRYMFKDETIKKTVEQYFEKNISELTKEDYDVLSKVDYLVVEETVESIDDLKVLFPNIKYLYLTIDELTSAKYDEIKGLKSLKALTIYFNSTAVSDYGNDFKYFEISYRDKENLPADNLLPHFSIGNDTFIKENVEGNIQKMVRINNNDYIYELYSTDSFIEGELYERQERIVFVYEIDSLICKGVLDASAEIGASVRNRLQLADVNFDGETDILVENGHFGTQGAVTYTCFLKDNNNYVRCDSFSEIANPAVDSENKKILSTWRNWAASHSFAMYIYQNKRFIMSSRLTEENQLVQTKKGEDEEVWKYSIEALEGAQLQLTEEFMDKDYMDEEIFKMIFDENTYWALTSDKWNTLYNQGKMIGFNIYGSSPINETIQQIISD